MKLICCNFKMNLLKKDIINYLDVINNKIKKDNLIFFPSIPYISMFNEAGFKVGSQDISFKELGSITGDTSILQLKELGISYTIIGHSERREYFDDDKYISNKINLALTNSIKVILCIGEKIKQEKIDTEFLKKEIDEAFKNNLNLINNNNLIIAYEPIWAIGSGEIPSNICIEETIFFIKKHIFDKYKININVLYGGSVSLDNIDILESVKGIDGYLIGGCSLKPENILNISSKLM
ncbi:MAG: triosephosphate isomerase [Bacilli bacterium]|nr:triosephosphate isomerase [Bacilli bacterium]